MERRHLLSDTPKEQQGNSRNEAMNKRLSCFVILLVGCNSEELSEEKRVLPNVEQPEYPQGNGTKIVASHLLVGENPMDWVGTTIAANGDYNGDQKADILIGAMMNDEVSEGAGKIYLVSAADLTSEVYDLSAAISFLPDLPGGCAGASVTFIDDMDSDGRDEILIGSPCNNKTYLFLAVNIMESNLLSSADRIYRGQEAGDYLGWSSANLGDIDGDGRGDFILGADGADNQGVSGGNAFVVKDIGSASEQPINIENVSTELWGEMAGEKVGNAVAGNGDFDGDGLMDVIVGAYDSQEGGDDSGKIYLASGSEIQSFGIQHLAHFAFASIGSEHDRAGTSLGFAGDVNGDGLDDVLIGAPNDSFEDRRTGRVYVLFSGQSVPDYLHQASATIYGLFAGDHSGFAVSGAGDYDADGYSDIVIGAPSLYDNFHAGAAYVFSGEEINAGGSLQIEDGTYILSGSASGDRMGYALAHGDVTGNGNDDVLVGAPGGDSGERGVVHVFLGN